MIRPVPHSHPWCVLRLFRAGGWLCLAFGLAGAARAQTPASPVLTTAAAVRALSPEEAGRGIPVRLTGVVTYLDQAPPDAPGPSPLYVDDGTSGIFVHARPADVAGLAAGDQVGVEGLASPGHFAPQVGGASGAAHVRPLGPGRFPKPLAVRAEDLASAQLEAQYVRLKGVVRAMGIHTNAPSGTQLRLTVSAGTRLFQVVVPDFGGKAGPPPGWLNAPVEVTGVCAPAFDHTSRRILEPRVRAATRAHLRVDTDAPAEWFRRPARSVQSLLQFDPDGARDPVVRLAGAVTLSRPGRGFYLRAPDGGLWVGTPQRDLPAVGAAVDVVGNLSLLGRRPVLQDAIVRTGAGENPPVPYPALDAEAAAGALDSTLITLEGRLDAVAGHPGALLLTLHGSVPFHARFEREPRPHAPAGWRAGARVRVTGVCESRGDPATGLPAPAGGFLLLCRGPEDVAVLEPPPWLTPARSGGIAAGLVLVGAATAAWITSLRRTVRRQTAEIERTVGERVVHAERRRIARELHDTLEQQLTALRMRLESAAAEVTEAPEQARASLGTALGILKFSHAETRLAVQDLRAEVLEAGGLVPALELLLPAPAGGGGPAVEVTVTGEPRRLPGTLELHLLRIAQEAVANALKHARARRIGVSLRFGATEVGLEVRDDGCGFDPAAVDGLGSRRFGLLGMRERAGKVNGTVTVESRPGAGARVAVFAPVPAPGDTA